jgi:hypothetical protein
LSENVSWIQLTISLHDVKDLSLPVSLFFCTVALGYVPRGGVSHLGVLADTPEDYGGDIHWHAVRILLVECFAV